MTATHINKTMFEIRYINVCVVHTCISTEACMHAAAVDRNLLVSVGSGRSVSSVVVAATGNQGDMCAVHKFHL